MSSIVVAALYHFVSLDNYKALRQPLLSLMLRNNIKGTLLLANEGINGTVAGTQAAIDILLEWLRKDDRLKNVKHKVSYDDKMPFYRSRVKLKKEIVTMGVPGIDPNHVVGTYVKPEDWNDLISDPDVVVIDTRNDYETGIGTFKGAVTAETDTFRQFPDFIKNNYSPEKNKKVAMFCTGGIRCEKSTALLKELGYEEVYHLQGGILKYLEKMPQEESLWEGECFVFDNRVSVDHNLEKGKYDQCFGCRMPISEEDKASIHYVEGISCPNCHEQRTKEQLQRFANRQKQINLAKQRGEEHLGSSMAELAQKRKQLKHELKKKQRKVKHR